MATITERQPGVFFARVFLPPTASGEKGRQVGSRNHAYVAMTRGRQENHALILDPHGTADPAERLTEIITRPARAHSALAVWQRLHHAAGVEPPALDDVDEPTRSTMSNEPQSATLEPVEKVTALTRRLDAIQQRATGRDTPGLGR